MKKIYFALLILLAIFCASLFIACDDNEEGTAPLPYRKEQGLWGYFEGTVAEEDFKVENLKNKDQLVTSVINSFATSDTAIFIVSTRIQYKEKADIRVLLWGLDEQLRVRYISEYIDWGWDVKADCIRLTQEDGIVYVPRKEHPLRAEILDLEWDNLGMPIVEVQLDGFLYNENNSLDSIKVNARYGTR